MAGLVIGILVVLLVVIEMVLRRRRMLSRTPYRDIWEAGQRSESRGKAVGKVYHFFMSYKSEDVATVRHISEQLIAEGLNVWFADYTILLDDRSRFQEAVAAGICQSKRGICFTNDRYVGSVYCRDEIEQLLEPQNCGPANVIEIAMPAESLPHRKYPQLADSPSAEYVSIEQALQHIRQVSGLGVDSRPRPPFLPEDRRKFAYYDTEYSLDVAGWEISEQSILPPSHGDVEGPKFRRRFRKNRVWGHVLIGREDISRQSIRGGTMDDRAYYEEAIKFAQMFFQTRWKQACVGVHLLFVRDFSHFAVTTLFMPGVWSRLYSVVLPSGGTGGDVEFAFFFFFKGAFREFCRHAHCMDRLVQSLMWP